MELALLVFIWTIVIAVILCVLFLAVLIIISCKELYIAHKEFCNEKDEEGKNNG